MARPKNADGQRTRQAILDAALDLFADKGYFGTSLRDVATVVGVRESALYNYFANKEALFEALIAADHDSRFERFSALLGDPGKDIRSLLEGVVLGSLMHFAEPRQEQLFRILMSDGIRLARAGRINLVERMSASQARLQALMRGFIRSGELRAGDPEMLALTFFAPLVVWRQLRAIDAGLPIVKNARAFARKHVDQFLQGAERRPRPTASPSARRRPSRASA